LLFLDRENEVLPPAVMLGSEIVWLLRLNEIHDVAIGHEVVAGVQALAMGLDRPLLVGTSTNSGDLLATVR